MRLQTFTQADPPSQAVQNMTLAPGQRPAPVSLLKMTSINYQLHQNNCEIYRLIPDVLLITKKEQRWTIQRILEDLKELMKGTCK